MSESSSRLPAVSLREIALVFSRIGISSFGGGLISWMHREAVERRRWLQEREFLSGLALSQVLPGANMVNLALYLGIQLRGGIGAVTAVLGLLWLPIIVIIAMFELYSRVSGAASVHVILDGVASAAVGLNIATGLKAIQRSKSLPAVAVALAVFLAVGVLHWPMLIVILCLAPLSVMLAWRTPPHG
jgi:chromate transporter